MKEKRNEMKERRVLCKRIWKKELKGGAHVKADIIWGVVKKQRSGLQSDRIRQKRVRSGKGQSGEKVLMIKQKNESNRGGIVDNFLSCDHVGCHGA